MSTALNNPSPSAFLITHSVPKSTDPYPESTAVSLSLSHTQSYSVCLSILILGESRPLLQSRIPRVDYMNYAFF